MASNAGEVVIMPELENPPNKLPSSFVELGDPMMKRLGFVELTGATRSTITSEEFDVALNINTKKG